MLFISIVVASDLFAMWFARQMVKKGNRPGVRPFLRWKQLFDAGVCLIGGVLFAVTDAWWMALILLLIGSTRLLFARNPETLLSLWFYLGERGLASATGSGTGADRERRSLGRDRSETPVASSMPQYLTIVTERLRADGFHIKHDVMHKGLAIRCVASRTRWEDEFFGYTRTVFIFAKFSSLDSESLRAFSKTCFHYASTYKGIPLPRPTGYSVHCFPVAIVDEVNTITSQALRTKGPPNHWCAVEMPVICEIGSGRLHYFEGTPYWGRLLWPLHRLTIQTMLATSE